MSSSVTRGTVDGVSYVRFSAASTEPTAVHHTGDTSVKSVAQYFGDVHGKREIIASSGTESSPIYGRGFVDTVLHAYNKHHILHLSPDNFFCAIMTQFAAYLNKYAEELRSVFVSHEGKKQLTVYSTDTLRTANYERLAQEMADQIGENIKDPEIRAWAMPKFSTTSSSDSAVYAVILMSAMQQYFTYSIVMCCGIPEVVLWGSVEDYKDLQARVERLLEFDTKDGYMKKWVALLRPIMAQLVAAASGSPDLAFWSKICSHHSNGSGPTYLSGWISTFTCFNEHGKWQGDCFEIRSFHNVKKLDYPVIETNRIAPGYVSVPVEINDHGTVHQTVMYAGSWCSDIVDKKELAPRLDWVLTKEADVAADANQRQRAAGTASVWAEPEAAAEDFLWGCLIL